MRTPPPHSPRIRRKHAYTPHRQAINPAWLLASSAGPFRVEAVTRNSLSAGSFICFLSSFLNLLLSISCPHQQDPKHGIRSRHSFPPGRSDISSWKREDQREEYCWWLWKSLCSSFSFSGWSLAASREQHTYAEKPYSFRLQVRWLKNVCPTWAVQSVIFFEEFINNKQQNSHDFSIFKLMVSWKESSLSSIPLHSGQQLPPSCYCWLE